jgi:hypothetical protein
MSTAQVNNILQLGGQAIATSSTSTSGPSIVLPAAENTKLVMLYGGEAGTTTGNRNIFTAANTATQVQYQVTAGKTFFAPGFWVTGTSAHTATPLSLILGYNPSTFASKSAPAAGDIFYGTSVSAYSIQAIYAAGVPVWVPFPVLFPASSFPFWIANAAESLICNMVGYEY